MPNLRCFISDDRGTQLFYIYQAAGGTALNLACFLALESMSVQLYYIYDALSGGTGGNPTVVDAPANNTDFSVLPGGIAPPGGSDLIYFAILDESSYWTIGAGDTVWTTVEKNL